MKRGAQPGQVDALDGTETGVKSLVFGLDGVHYVICLGPANRAVLRNLMHDYVMNARRAGDRGAGVAGRAMWKRSATVREKQRLENSLIREWARTQGFRVAGTGRMPTAVVAAYRAR